MENTKKLPSELTRLVSWSVAQLGLVIKEQAGSKTFQLVEKLRRQTLTTRGSTELHTAQVLTKMYTQLNKQPTQVQHDVAHAFGLMLELINVCESAYRAHRLKPYDYDPSQKNRIERITYVLTAHPTEAKNIELIEIFKNIQNTLIQSLKESPGKHQNQLKFWLGLCWRLPLAKHKKPTVKDEAESIFSLVLVESILDEWIQLADSNTPVYLRTWVGGDKDGHPGVDEKAMLQSLNTSRDRIIEYLATRIDKSEKALNRLERKYVTLTIISQMKSLKNQLLNIRSIKNGDGAALFNIKKDLSRLMKVYQQEFGFSCFYLGQFQTLTNLLPGLVIPLELREDSEVVAEAVMAPQKFAIGRMLKTLQTISSKSPTHWYAKGFVLSMTESSQDMLNGVNLVKKTIQEQDLPVVPLFENEKALVLAPQILQEFATAPAMKTLVHKKWDSMLEIMVGYSDSSKENGSFRSKQLIESSLFKIDNVITHLGFLPRFFHGSGGSVARGGGSIEDQTSWWPQTAKHRFKATIQGEMIARSFSSPEVFARQAEKIIFQAKTKSAPQSKETRQLLETFSIKTRDAYREKVNSPEFMKVIGESTPYNYLQHLKIGSRPAKRKKELNLKNLRAIPWILCWTQTRVLFPSWWGLGTAWKSLSKVEQQKLKVAYNKSPMFRSYVKLMGFTLEKVSLGVWLLYLKHSRLGKSQKETIFKEIKLELTRAKTCIRSLSGNKNLLWYRPWLGVSISLRTPLIHPLNVLQVIALKKEDHHLLRETVTGIASGMMTTG